MKKSIIIFAALGLFFLNFESSQVTAGGFGPNGNSGPVYGSGAYRPFGCGAGIYSAPWYLFFPYDNYFNMPAPPAYPYWPQQNLGGSATRPSGNPGTMLPATYIPGSVPSYWLGR